MSTSLQEFNDVEPPSIKEREWVHHPDRYDSILGTLGESNRGTPCFTAQRTRFKNAEVQDYYRKIGGYSLVTETAKALQRNGIGKIFIEETDNDRILEYDTSVFISEGELVDDWQGEEQICCPVEFATHEWAIDEIEISRMER